MTQVDTWSMTNINMVNDRCRYLSMTSVKLVNDKCREKWSQKGADGSFQEESMTNVDTWSMTNVNIANDRYRQIVNDKCKVSQ